MSHTKLLCRSEAREKVLRGAAALADAVRITLGPKSRCVVIEQKWGPPLVCNDGVTIAKAVDLEDPDNRRRHHRCDQGFAGCARERRVDCGNAASRRSDADAVTRTRARGIRQRSSLNETGALS